MDNIVCRKIDLPGKINAITVVDENGDYNVYVNSRLSVIEQKNAFSHEKRHITKCHFYCNKNIIACEREADMRA